MLMLLCFALWKDALLVSFGGGCRGSCPGSCQPRWCDRSLSIQQHRSGKQSLAESAKKYFGCNKYVTDEYFSLTRLHQRKQNSVHWRTRTEFSQISMAVMTGGNLTESSNHIMFIQCTRAIRTIQKPSRLQYLPACRQAQRGTEAWRLVQDQGDPVEGGRLDSQRDQGFRSAGQRWSRFPYRHEVEFHEQTQRWPVSAERICF